jgi:hypothetical protein
MAQTRTIYTGDHDGIWERAAKLAREQRFSMSALVLTLLEDWIERQEKGHPSEAADHHEQPA